MLRCPPQRGQDRGHHVHSFEWETLREKPTHTGHAGETFIVGASRLDLWG